VIVSEFGSSRARRKECLSQRLVTSSPTNSGTTHERFCLANGDKVATVKRPAIKIMSKITIKIKIEI
jgi:hypothetical protein